MKQSIHQSVLLNETIEGLNLSKNPVVIDGTFGGGGHSLEICKRYQGARIVALDQDQSALKRAEDKFKGIDCEVTYHQANFREMDEVLAKENLSGVDGVVLDLGLSSDQLDSSLRGFSFKNDEPLIMTMKENPRIDDLTAKDVVNEWSEENLASIIYGYGEEKFSRKIAKAIVESRREKPIETTFQLVSIIESAVPAGYRKGRIHPATKTFQALRIAVNDELRALQEGLEKGLKVLKSGGRMSVISFHSLEDRIVKRFYKVKEKEGVVKLINKKPIISKAEELKNNPRARSAKLRVLEKL